MQDEELGTSESAETMGTEVSRRAFLKGAAVVAATGVTTIALGSAVGCTPDDTTDEAAVQWDRETDVVVVGFGGAGTVAAVTAHEAGAEVLILEKAPVEGGGCSRTSGGFVTVVKDASRVEDAVEYMKTASMGLTPEAVYRAWAEEGAKTTEWLDAHGILYADLSEMGMGSDFPNWPGADAIGSVDMTNEDGLFNGGGKIFWEWATQYMSDAGVEILFDTPATALVQDPDTKEIIGVRATSGGVELLIKARKGVVLASGGFEANDAMLGSYIRPYPMVPVGWQYNTGDGIKMAQAVGADLWHMNLPCAHGFVFIDPGLTVGRWGASGSSWKSGSFMFIDHWGKRFACENPSNFFGHRSFMEFDNYDQSGTYTDASYERIPFYVVFDEKERAAGPVFASGQTIGVTTIPKELGGADDWSADNLAEIESGWILKADTIEELAAKIDAFSIDPATLKATVDTYNQYCATGVDLDFGRPAESSDMPNLVALDTPPYYAIKMQPSLYSTCGGPVKNEKAQVIDTSGNVIPRLYVAGVLGHSAAHVYSTFGQNWAEIMNFGRIAGRNAAAETSVGAAAVEEKRMHESPGVSDQIRSETPVKGV